MNQAHKTIAYSLRFLCLSLLVLLLSSGCQSNQASYDPYSWSEEQNGILMGLYADNGKIRLKLKNITPKDMEFRIGSSFNDGKIIIYHTLSILHKEGPESNWDRYEHNWMHYEKVKNYVQPLQVHLPAGESIEILTDANDFRSPDNKLQSLNLNSESVLKAELNISHPEKNRTQTSPILSEIYTY